jgi:protein phosphatase
LTLDHSLVQELIQHGYLTEEEARVSEHRNVLTRALGIEPEVDADVQQHALRSGDLYLLCSDGLTNLVCDRDIQVYLRRLIASPQDAVQELIRTAKERGGYDNISVILVLMK